MIIRRATSTDAAALAALGERTFRDAFGAQNTPEDMNAYASAAFGEARQRAEIENPELISLVVEEDGILIGYAQVRRDENARAELVRFYVERAHHGRGLAQELMEATFNAARNLGATTLWLGVWEHNPRAIRFYEKCGFVDVGSHPFLLGSDLQTDRVMERGLEAES